MAWIDKKKRSDGGVSARVVWRQGGGELAHGLDHELGDVAREAHLDQFCTVLCDLIEGFLHGVVHALAVAERQVAQVQGRGDADAPAVMADFASRGLAAPAD